MKRALLLLALLLPMLPALADKPTAPEQISGAINLNAEQLAEKILTTPGVVLIDARRYEEYAKGHIEGALNLLDTDMTPQLLARHLPSKETPVIFYCNGERCLRSSHATEKALHWGYRNVFWFRGGWQEWTRKEMPIAN